MNPATIGTLAIIAFLLVVAFLIWRANGHSDQPEPDRLDSMIDVVRDNRDEGNQNLAWPPQVQEPSLVEKLPPRLAQDPCGCLWLQGGWWSPCRIHDPDELTAYIDAYADQWAADIAQEDM